MSLLQPLGLLLAGLAAIPLLLHLMRRQVVQRIAFPALRYLRDAEQRTARSLRLRDLLLLATRVALILLLAVAAARPLVGRGGIADHAPTDAILLIDNTASLGRVHEGRTLFDLQLEAARATLGHATSADRFWVVPAAGAPLASGVDAATARRMLDSLTLSAAGADLVERIEVATTAVPVEPDRVREVQVYTDRQASGFAGGPLDLSAWGSVAVAVASVEPSANRFVADLRLEPDGVVVPGAPPAVAARIAVLPEGATTDTVDVRAIVDGETAAMARAAPGSEVLVPLPDLEPGAHVVHLELPPSGLRADDVRRLGVVVAPAPVVRHAGGGDGFFETALATLVADGRVRASGDDAVHVVEGGASPPPGGGRAIVLVPPAELTRLPAFQQRLDALGVPWRLEGSVGAGDVELRDPGDLAALDGLRVGFAYDLRRLPAPATPEDSVLVTTSDDAPWLVRGRVGERVYLLFASPLDADATGLPVSAAMVPFVEHLLVRWSRPSAAAVRDVDAGARIPLPPRIDGLVTPAGDTLPAEGGAPWTPLEAGTWTWLLPAGSEGDATTIARRVGVNVPAAESDPAPATGRRIREALAGTDVRLAASPAGWTDVVFGTRRGAEMTPWLAAGFALLALAELLLAAPGRRRAAEEDAA